MKDKKDKDSKYLSTLDDKHTKVIDRRLGAKDVNPMLKINYDGENYKDTRGPKDYNLSPLSKGEKRARILFVMTDQYDKIPYWTFGPAYLAAVL